MRYVFAFLFALIVMFPAGPASGQVQTPTVGGVPTLAPLLKDITPAVVNIAVRTKTAQEQNPLLQDPFYRFFFDLPEQQQRPQVSAGSGVIIDARKGYVMTNHHVVDNADQIVVTLKDRRSFRAELIGSDKGTDIALLKIEPENLTALKLGNSDSLRVGDFVVAIGNPFGIGQTVTSGIVSALGRSGLNIEGYEDFIQTDASINPGNSGGALVNLKGELIGINTAIIGPGGGNVGIGFAVPMRMAKAVMNQLLQFGEVRRGRLGVAIQDVTPDIAAAMALQTNRGAILSKIDAKSAAEKAGLKAGDVVIAVNGDMLANSADFRNRIGLIPVGEEVELTIVRGGETLEKTVKIGRASAAEIASRDGAPQLSGAVVMDIPDEHRMSGKIAGALVAQVEPGSRAWRNGLRQGDIIVAVNRRRVKGVDDFARSVKTDSKVIAMNVVRDGHELFMVLQ